MSGGGRFSALGNALKQAMAVQLKMGQEGRASEERFREKYPFFDPRMKERMPATTTPGMEATPEQLATMERSVGDEGLTPYARGKAAEFLKTGRGTSQTTPFGEQLASGMFDPTTVTGRPAGEYISRKDRITLEQNAELLKQKGVTALHEAFVSLRELEQTDEDISIKRKKADIELQKLTLEIKKARDSKDKDTADLLMESKKLLQKDIQERIKIAEKLVSPRQAQELLEDVYPLGAPGEARGRGRAGILEFAMGGPLAIIYKGLTGGRPTKASRQFQAVATDFETGLPDALGKFPLEEIIRAIDRNQFMVRGKRVKLNRQERNLLKKRARQIYLMR